ncbi:MAG TPA: GNAT family N-acetyltransferase [Firmicutes bacterium]|nr:GNAT family N-acetyltransferase [Bacillota bacterium]
MIEIRRIDAQHKSDIHIPNEPFPMFGRILPSFHNGRWAYELERYNPENVIEMTFPDEHYDYEAMQDSVFLGAYDGTNCAGLAILQPGFFKYMYLYDLKVKKEYRRQHIGRALIEKAKEIAAQDGYCGLYTQGQDDNPGACLFYLHSGFSIGGLDTNVYRHTKQEGKADILFYCEID